MASSPKCFCARRPPFRRRLTVLIFYTGIVLGFIFIFGLVALLSSSSQLRSVQVVWEKICAAKTTEHGLVLNGGRHKLTGFVGIQTGFGSVGRRESLRKTWMPSDAQGLQRLEEATGLAFRFIIGKSKDEAKMLELKKEIERYDDFLLLDIEEEYTKLPYKTLAFFKAAYALFDSNFYVKADDDIYLRPDRLSTLLAKERSHSQTYLGCMKKGPVFRNPKLKRYEPLGYLLGSEYFYHAYGPLYALSADVVASLVALRNNSFRMFGNEDVTIGAWMLALNVNHENNRALCSPECKSLSIAVWDIKCSGLCDPEKELLELHQMDSCTESPTKESDMIGSVASAGL